VSEGEKFSDNLTILSGTYCSCAASLTRMIKFAYNKNCISTSLLGLSS